MQSQERFGPCLVSLTAALAAVAICGLRPVAGQALQQTAKPLVIYEVLGKDTVHVGDVETYRARTNTSRDVEFRWSANGSTSLGNPIVHRFQRPGSFDVVVTARNTISTARDTFRITVLGPPMAGRTADATVESSNQPSAGTETAGATTEGAAGGTAAAAVTTGGADSEQSSGFRGPGDGRVDQDAEGYTWVIATYFQRPSAVALANSYRASGYKAGVVSDQSGQGSEVYRVLLGEFSTEQNAMRAKGHLIRAGHKNPILRELGRRG